MSWRPSEIVRLMLPRLQLWLGHYVSEISPDWPPKKLGWATGTWFFKGPLQEILFLRFEVTWNIPIPIAGQVFSCPSGQSHLRWNWWARRIVRKPKDSGSDFGGHFGGKWICRWRKSLWNSTYSILYHLEVWQERRSGRGGGKGFSLWRWRCGKAHLRNWKVLTSLTWVIYDVLIIHVTSDFS